MDARLERPLLRAATEGSLNSRLEMTFLFIRLVTYCLLSRLARTLASAELFFIVLLFVS